MELVAGKKRNLTTLKVARRFSERRRSAPENSDAERFCFLLQKRKNCMTSLICLRQHSCA